MTGMNSNAVSVMLHRVRRTLRECIERQLSGPTGLQRSPEEPLMRDPAELISAYFDDNLAEGELDQLRAWLAADPERMRQFARESVIHSRLRDMLLQHDMRSLVFGERIRRRGRSAAHREFARRGGGGLGAASRARPPSNCAGEAGRRAAGRACSTAS